MRRRPPLAYGALAAALALGLMAPNLGAAEVARWKGKPVPPPSEEPPQTYPEDRYAMAGGCYLIRSQAGYVTAAGDGYATTRDSKAATPFHFQATDLGRYLLYDPSQRFLAASEGAVAEALYGVTQSTPGATAGGLAGERTDQLADEIAHSELNDETGRGDSVVAAAEPSELADWRIDEAPGHSFTLVLPATDQALGTNKPGKLQLTGIRKAESFRFEAAQGCAEYPEIEVNVEGDVLASATPFQETRGYFDAHLHMMAFEFLGGRARCGRPWHPYGVTFALVDCPDHEPGGHGAVLEAVLSGGNPVQGHNTDGWPSFAGWPRYNSLTHEQVYYKWLERAWRGGLRMFTNLLVDNNQLCKIYPYKRNSCNEMDGVRLQARRIRELERYIDAQSGGPGEGWFRIVDDPFEAREVINQGKLAVVLGIEVSVPLDCGRFLDQPNCTKEDIDRRLDEVYGMGVRQMELVNKFDNALSGVAGDAGTTGVVVNQGNKMETGHYWRMETCTESDGHAHDKPQMNFHDQSGAPDQFSGRDSLAGAILALSGRSGAVPVYPEGPHCNTVDLSPLGAHMIRGMAQRGMIFDPDHMSARAQTQALNLIEELGHSGIISSHGWSNDTIYPRIYRMGGVVAPYAGGSRGFVEDWRQHRQWADERFYFGFGYGADTNGFGSQGGPRGANVPDPVEYPFTGLGGVTVHQQQSGTRTYDINTDGVAHYGLYPDWIEDLRRQAGDAIVEDMARGVEAYLQMWERAIGVPGDACRADVADLTDEQMAALAPGMAWAEVLWKLGQPNSRLGSDFAFCMTDGRRAVVTFGPEGTVSTWSVS